MRNTKRVLLKDQTYKLKYKYYNSTEGLFYRTSYNSFCSGFVDSWLNNVETKFKVSTHNACWTIKNKPLIFRVNFI